MESAKQGAVRSRLQDPLIANLETRSLVDRRAPRTTRPEGPAFLTNEEPVLAGVGLTPTAALDEQEQ